MIPPFNERGYLPPGEHQLTNCEELVTRFGNTARREKLLEGLTRVLTNLQQAGCQKVYLDGSFVTDSPEPSDYDGCWDSEGIKINQLDPILLNCTEEGCQQQKDKYGGELLTLDTTSNNKYPPFGETKSLMLECYQVDEYGNQKGIVVIQLQELKL